LSQEGKSEFLNLPNFSWEIFTKITWVKPVEQSTILDDLVWKEISVEVEGRIYKAKIIN
jgi:hypothetical protein